MNLPPRPEDATPTTVVVNWLARLPLAQATLDLKFVVTAQHEPLTVALAHS